MDDLSTQVTTREDERARCERAAAFSPQLKALDEEVLHAISAQNRADAGSSSALGSGGIHPALECLPPLDAGILKDVRKLVSYCVSENYPRGSRGAAPLHNALARPGTQHALTWTSQGVRFLCLATRQEVRVVEGHLPQVPPLHPDHQTNCRGSG